MQTNTAKQLAEFTAEMIELHYGPGPHPDGSPQSVHGGGTTGLGGTQATPHSRAIQANTALKEAWDAGARLPGDWRPAVAAGNYTSQQGDVTHRLHVATMQDEPVGTRARGYRVTATLLTKHKDNPGEARAVLFESAHPRQQGVAAAEDRLTALIEKRLGIANPDNHYFGVRNFD